MEENSQGGLTQQEGSENAPFQSTTNTGATTATPETGLGEEEDGSGDSQTQDPDGANGSQIKDDPDAPDTELPVKAGEDEEIGEVAETDEDILRRVAKAAHAEAGGDGDGGIDALLAAQYFKNNREAHPDQYWELLSKRRGTSEGFYEQPEEVQNYYGAFAASVKNAYYPAEQD